MLRHYRVMVASTSLAAVVVLGSARGEAHKPITSPYTFNEDVYPILRERCGRCHVDGGSAPMSLMTHQDTVPWSESIRIELMAGHMPPWGVDAPAERFRHPQSLTARELNVVLTWASGGTPIGSSEKTPARVELERGWRLGPPDVVMPLPEFTMTPDKQDDTVEFVLDASTTEPRWLRAVDLQPGTPAIVRDARIVVRSAASDHSRGRAVPEQVLAVWLPGDDVVEVESGVAFQLPARAELLVRMHYKKTWQYERTAMSDRSNVGLYFAAGPASPLRALSLTAPPTSANGAPGSGPAVTFDSVIDEDLRALAIYPDSTLANVSAHVEAIRPDGSRERLLSLRAQKDWARRYWFSKPVKLTRGTTIRVQATLDAKTPGVESSSAIVPADPSAIRLTLNVVSGP